MRQIKWIWVFFAILGLAAIAWAADTKLSALTELAATPATTDEIYINDGGVSKRIQYSNLMDGEALKVDSVDDDSIDFVDVTLTDLTFDVGSVSKTEYGYLNGVTSAIQTQLDAKEGTLTNSAGLASAISDETGTGTVVFSSSPTLVTPALGTIASGDGNALTNLNGENIANDTIDDDSIDFTDVTSSDITFDADSVATTAVYSGTTSLEETTAANDSGAYIIGVFDEFGNSNSTNVQDVLDDFDGVLTGITADVTGVGDCASGACLDGTSDGGTYVRVYDGDSNYTQLASSNVGTNITVSLPTVAGVVLTTDGAGTSLTALNGENIQNDTIDDDSIDFADVTLADYATGAGSTGYILKDDGDGTFSFAGSLPSQVSIPLTTGSVFVGSGGNASEVAIAENYLLGNDSGTTTAVQVDGSMLAADDFGDWTVASGQATLDNDVIDEANLNAANSPTDEFVLSYEADTSNFQWVSVAGGGDITTVGDCTTGDCTSAFIAANDMADADHGHVSWTTGAATVEDFALNAAADGGDQNITNLGDLSVDTIQADASNVTIGGASDDIITVWDGTPDADDTYSGTIIRGKNAGEAVSQWELVYFDTVDSEFKQADANAAGEWPAWYMAVEAGTDGNEMRVLKEGIVRNDAWNWTVGATLYLDETTPGGMTETAPSTTGDCIQWVGKAITADVVDININHHFGYAEAN